MLGYFFLQTICLIVFVAKFERFEVFSLLMQKHRSRTAQKSNHFQKIFKNREFQKDFQKPRKNLNFENFIEYFTKSEKCVALFAYQIYLSFDIPSSFCWYSVCKMKKVSDTLKESRIRTTLVEKVWFIWIRFCFAANSEILYQKSINDRLHSWCGKPQYVII